MICVDTSALIAIYFGEPEAEDFVGRLAEHDDVRAGAPTILEFFMVARGSRGDRGHAEAELLLRTLSIQIQSFTPEMLDLAIDAFSRFGKGRHPAALNFGDCMSYAFAQGLDAPLLYKGTDFALTNIRSAAG